MQGFLRGNGEIGIRNKLVIVYSHYLARPVAEKISHAMASSEIFGIEDKTGTAAGDILKSLCRHPNVGAVLVVELTAAGSLSKELVEEAVASGRSAAVLRVLDGGGSVKAVLEGIRAASLLLRQAEEGRRVPVSLADLVIGIRVEEDDLPEHEAMRWVIAWLTKKGRVVWNGPVGRQPASATLLSPAAKPERPGLYWTDGNQISDLLAAGAQLILLVSSRGSVTGSIGAPVVKVCLDSEHYRRLADDMDLDAGQAAGGDAIEIGRAILEKLVEVAAGEPSKAEILQNRQYCF